MSAAKRPAALTAADHRPSCDSWADVEWRASAVAPVLLIVPTTKLRHALEEIIDESIGTDDLTRGLLIAEQELPSVIVLEVSPQWTDRQLDTMIRLQRLLPHASFVAIAPKLAKEGVRIAMHCLSLDAFLYDKPPFVAERVIKYRSRYLEELVERAAQAGKVRR